MSNDEQEAVFNKALFFNKEVTGLKIKQLNRDPALYKKFKPLAVFNSGSEGD